MALNLETFTPERINQASRPLPTLEALRMVEQDAYERGVRDGAEASAREHMQSQTTIRTQFVEALLDERMTQQAIVLSVTRDMLATFESVVRTILPELADHALVETLKTQLDGALSACPDTKPILSCAPELVPGVEAALVDWSGEMEIRSDPKLTPLEAKLAWDNGFDHIDLQSLTENMLTQIQNFKAKSLTLSEDVKHVG